MNSVLDKERGFPEQSCMWDNQEYVKAQAFVKCNSSQQECLIALLEVQMKALLSNSVSLKQSVQ